MRKLWAPAAFLFRSGVRLRHLLYDRGWLKEQEAPLPVVSIGNVTVGGTGKTPVTLKLAQALASSCKVAIISRGYRSDAEKRREPLVVSKGKGPQVEAHACGDEVFLLARRVPEALVIACKDRLKGVRVAAELGAQIALLDDGMQHRKIKKTMEIGVIGRENPYTASFLPQGLLRDLPYRLARADQLIVNGKVTFESTFPYIRVEHSVSGVYDLHTGNKIPSLEKKKIAVFCGIGNPQGFVATLESLGACIVAAEFLPDHLSIRKRQLNRLMKNARLVGAELVVCTEKDAVKKIPNIENGLPIAWVESDLTITENRKIWEGLVEQIKNLSRST